ncbi:MAG: zinc-dependent metalloprotease [Pseudomonadota bacterium]
MRSIIKTTSALSGLLAAALVGSCAQEIGDINRVQPDYVKKADLDGEWYFKPTITESQYNQGMLFEGWEGQMEKIRWEVQEDVLLGYRSYEVNPPLDGEEGHGAEGLDNPGSNSPIVGFRIVSHFDIRRQYNPTTGIENNILEENTSDRPWWERDYMRVDWSTSVVDNPFDIGGFATAYYSDYREYVSETWETDPNRLRVSPSYIDFVINIGMTVDLETCYYEFQDNLDWCGASEGKMRMSFRKVGDIDAYQPLEYPDYLPVQYRERYRDTRSGLPCDPSATEYQGNNFCSYIGLCLPNTSADDDPFCRPEAHDLYVSYDGYICDDDFNPDDCYQYSIGVFETYGYFRTIRYRYDATRGYLLDGRQMLINRWNLWEKSFDANGVVIPYADRKTKPVVYYTSTSFPEWLRPSADRFINQWDVAFRQTVATLRGLEYDHNNPDDVRAKVPERMFELRRNSCNPDNIKAYANKHDLVDVIERVAGSIDDIADGNIERVCAALEYQSRNLDEPFDWQRHGDLRYSMINWVDTPQIVGPLGYGPSSADPETGEIVNSNANIYGAAMYTWTKRYADIISLINGDISESDVEGGEYIREAIEASRGHRTDSLSMSEVAAVMNQVDQVMAESSGEDYLPQVPPGEHERRMRQIDGTGLDRELLTNDETLRGLAGPKFYQPGQPVTEDAYNKARPSRLAAHSAPALFQPGRGDHVALNSTLANEERLVHFFASRNVMLPNAFNEPAMIGMAHDLKGKSRDEVHRYLMDAAFESVAGHEVGHTIGLRHNFAGSTDAMNFFPEFWAIKSLDTDPATALTQIDNVDWVLPAKLAEMKQRLNRCVGSGLNTQECLRITEYMYSSIMDYGQRINHDISGIGMWDYAAIKFGYGQIMEAYDERQGDFLTDEYEMSYLLGLMDYSDIPVAMSGTDMDAVFWAARNAVGDAETQVVTLPRPCAWNEAAGTDGCRTPGYANIYKRRDVMFGDYVNDYIADLFLSNYDQKIRNVEYAYCSDTFAWGGNLYCNLWDLGANVTEIVTNARQLYDYYYLFNNFKNDRFGWGSVNSYLARLDQRTLTPIKYSFNYYYYYRNSQARMWPMIQDWAHAAFDGLNFLGQILQTPEPGTFCLESSLNTYTRQRGATCASGDSITVGLGQGRYYNSRWSQEYFYKPLVIGNFWDKILAIGTMTDSSAYFYRNFADVFDRGSFSITYYRVFTDEMIQLFKGMMNGDYESYASEVQTVDGKPTVVPRRIVGQTTTSGTPAPMIMPGQNYFLKFYSMYNAVFGLTSTVDRHLDFMDRTRVHLVGEVNEPSYDGYDPAELATFIDPRTNYTYRAAPIDALRDPLTGDIIDTSRSIGYEYLVDANDFVATSWQPSKDALDAAQTACDADPECDLDHPDNATWQALGTADMNFAAVDGQLTDRIENLDVLRMFVNELPYSNL